MKSGIIMAHKARGDVYFKNMNGKEILPASRNVEVPIKEFFLIIIIIQPALTTR